MASSKRSQPKSKKEKELSAAAREELDIIQEMLDDGETDVEVVQRMVSERKWPKEALELRPQPKKKKASSLAGVPLGMGHLAPNVDSFLVLSSTGRND